VHFCHISRKDEIEWIAEAKRQGLRSDVRGDPTISFLTDADAVRLVIRDMRPRLACQSDVDALLSHINTTIDCVASDHAPHTLVEKQASQNPPPGVPGLESTLPLLLNAAAEGRISYDRIVSLLSTNPRRIYSLPEQPDTWVEIDPEESFEFPDHELYTKCAWSPFSGTLIKGRIRGLRRKELGQNRIVHDFVRYKKSIINLGENNE
jgi:carbamoyl-phosphate synthase/aspartate carbamoyltransferase/dihydroorotase